VTPETAIRDRIVALGTVAGSRVYLLVLPQSPTLPAVRVQLIDDAGFAHLRGGGSDLRKARVQVDAYAREASGTDPYDVASGLADEINGDDAGSGLSGYRGTVSGMEIQSVAFVDRQPIYEADELRLVRVRQDFFVWYRPT
jgi:hypothetical protein